MNGLAYIVVVMSLGIVFSGYHLAKALGLFIYEDGEKEKAYKEWLEREGNFRVFTGSVSIAIFIFLLIWAFFLF